MVNIGVFGGTLADIYIYGEEPHRSEILELPGGSGLNIAFGLFSIGYNVDFFTNIGSDYRGDFLLSVLRGCDFPTEHMEIVDQKTGFHIAFNDRTIGVERGANRLPIDIGKVDFTVYDLIVVNTEIPVESVKEIFFTAKSNVFFDVGPRAGVDLKFEKEIAGRSVLTVGNSLECKGKTCDVVKLGRAGARWGELMANGNNETYSYTIGTGDTFDVVLIDGLLKGQEERAALKRAVKISQNLARDTPGAFNKMRALPALLRSN